MKDDAKKLEQIEICKVWTEAIHCIWSILSKKKNTWAFNIYNSCPNYTQWSKIWISTGNHPPRVWSKSQQTQIPNHLRSIVKSRQLVRIWGTMSSAGVSLCFVDSNVSAFFFQEILKNFNLPSFVKAFFFRLKFHFSAGPEPFHIF